MCYYVTSCCMPSLLKVNTLNLFSKNSMKKLQGYCVSWLVLLWTRIVCGQGVYIPGMCLHLSQIMFWIQSIHALLIQCTCLWDQPSSLTTLRSSSLILERMLRVVCPLSPVTLISLPAVEAGLTIMAREDWAGGVILMGGLLKRKFIIIIIIILMNSNSTL